ncbi:hypothetical protein AALO_G00251320 [Alosa alosa]|uniref:Cytosolic fatty-acid binding proteins domain-containing protein n=1 Tax=Alosa alosa TaxID=278164 RepID=A0AAV6FSM8_9TELE|nr:hypothetical protein AALO_G00251320 [Alosa alosa]
MSQALIGWLSHHLAAEMIEKPHMSPDQTQHPRDQSRPDAAAIMAEKFVGTWKMVESEHFDEYFKALGMKGFILVLRAESGGSSWW